MRTFFSALALAAFLAAGASASIPLTYDFAHGIPSGATLLEGDTLTINQLHYRNIEAQSAPWIVKNFGKQKVALSPTSTGKGGEGECQSNWLIMEPVTLSAANPSVRWRTRSLCEALPESYRIVCREVGSSAWTTLFTCNPESPRWTWHSASLIDFAGKTVEVAIECTSRDCFMLALQEISVCPEESKVEINNLTNHYQSSGEALIEGSISSFLSMETPIEITLTVGENTYSVESDGDFSFSLPLSEGEVIEYSLTAGDAQINDFICCSPFPRLAIVDHLCATWCNNCPYFSLNTDPIIDQMGSDMLMLETHVYSAASDPWMFKDYAEVFNYVFSVPCMVANRNSATYSGTASRNVEYVQAELRQPTTFGLELTGTNNGDGSLNLSAIISSLPESNVEEGRYSLLVTQICDFQGDDVRRFNQQNNAAIAAYEQWYYMPSLITGRMLLLRNLPVSCKEIAIPTSDLTSEQPSKVDFSLDLLAPEDSFNPRVLAFLIDNESGQVVNAAIADAVNPPAALDSIPSDLQAQEEWPIEYFDLMGRQVSTPSLGDILIRRQGTKTEKIIIR